MMMSEKSDLRGTQPTIAGFTVEKSPELSMCSQSPELSMCSLEKM